MISPGWRSLAVKLLIVSGMLAVLGFLGRATFRAALGVERMCNDKGGYVQRLEQAIQQTEDITLGR